MEATLQEKYANAIEAGECRRIEISSVKEVEIKDENGKTKKFLAYKAVTKQNKLIDLKFTRDCVGIIPKSAGYIYVPYDGYNVQTNTKYPAVWVKEVWDYEPYSTKGDDTF